MRVGVTSPFDPVSLRIIHGFSQADVDTCALEDEGDTTILPNGCKFVGVDLSDNTSAHLLPSRLAGLHAIVHTRGLLSACSHHAAPSKGDNSHSHSHSSGSQSHDDNDSPTVESVLHDIRRRKEEKEQQSHTHASVPMDEPSMEMVIAQNLVKACKEIEDLKLIINIFTRESLENPDHKAVSDYLQAQATSEGLFTVVSLLINEVWGTPQCPRVESALQAAQLGLTRFFVDGEHNVTWTHVDNITQLCLVVISKHTDPMVKGQQFFVTDGQVENVFEFLAPVYRQLGFAAPSIRVPKSKAAFYSSCLEFVCESIGGFQTFVRPTDLSQSEDDTAMRNELKLAKEKLAKIGYRPFAVRSPETLHALAGMAEAEGYTGWRPPWTPFSVMCGVLAWLPIILLVALWRDPMVLEDNFPQFFVDSVVQSFVPQRDTVTVLLITCAVTQTLMALEAGRVAFVARLEAFWWFRRSLMVGLLSTRDLVNHLQIPATFLVVKTSVAHVILFFVVRYIYVRLPSF